MNDAQLKATVGRRLPRPPSQKTIWLVTIGAVLTAFAVAVLIVLAVPEPWVNRTPNSQMAEVAAIEMDRKRIETGLAPSDGSNLLKARIELLEAKVKLLEVKIDKLEGEK